MQLDGSLRASSSGVSPQTFENVSCSSQCGKDMTPAAVVECTKQLMAIVSPPTPAFSAAVDRPVTQGATASHRSRRNAAKQRTEWRCFNCHQLGHLARDCTAEMPTLSAVSGNSLW